MALNKNAKKWVEALKSGIFKQADGRLAKDGKFCCLGVACVLAFAEGVIPAPGTDIHGDTIFDDNSHYLPNSVKDWLGLGDEQGRFQVGAARHSLAKMNDTGDTFAEIAAKIESEPKGLFKPRKKAVRKTRKGKK